MKGLLKRALPWLLAFFVPIGVFLVALWVLPHFGITRSILYSDPNVEFVDFLAYFKSLISGDSSLFYSFNLNTGAGMIPLVAFYLFSPFNLLVAFFDNSMLGYAFFLIILLEIGAIGLTSYYYFRKEHAKLGRFKPLIFAWGLALSAFVLGYFEHFEWLDSIVMLPLVCLGINKIVRGEKPWLYMIALMVAVLTCYYSGFMICIFSIIWFLYRQFLQADGFKKNFWKHTKAYILSSILAGCSAMFLLLPSAFAMFSGNMNRVDSGAFTFDSKFPLKQLILQLTSNSAYYQPLFFAGIIVTILFVLYFVNKKIRTREKLASVAVIFALIASMNVRILCAIWHLGSVELGAPYRFTFIVAFFVAVLAARALEEFNGYTKNRIAAVFLWCLTLYVLMMPESIDEFKNILLYLDIILAGLGLVIVYKLGASSKKGTILSGILILAQLLSVSAFTLNELIMLGKWELGVSSFRTTEEEIREIGEAVDATKSLETNNDFYRVEKTFARDRNDGLQFGYNGIYSYTSTAKPLVGALLLSDWYFAPNAVYDAANNGALMTGDLPPLASISLSGIKYVISTKDLTLNENYFTKRAETEKYDVYEYNMALSVGLVVDEDVLSKVDSSPMSVFERINEISKEQINEEVFQKVDGVTIALDNLAETDYGYAKIVPDNDGVITYKIHNPSRENVFYMAYLTTPGGSHATEISEVLIKNESGDFEHLSHLSSGGMLNFGNDEEIEVRIKVLTDKLSIREEVFYNEDLEATEALYTNLHRQESDWELVSNTELKGEVDVEKDNQVLLMTLVHDESWQVTVDGEEVTPENVMGGVIGLPLEKGKHTITMKYVPRGWKVGVVVSLASVGGMITWYLVDRKSRRCARK